MPLLLFFRLGIIIETSRKGGFLKSAFLCHWKDCRKDMRQLGGERNYGKK